MSDTDGPTGQDRSEPPPGWKWLERRHGTCERRSSANAMGWKSSLAEAWAKWDEEHAGAGQDVGALTQIRVQQTMLDSYQHDVAALRAELERLKFQFDGCRQLADAERGWKEESWAEVSALREQLATVMRERDEARADVDVAFEASDQVAAEHLCSDCFDELATARERIAALEAGDAALLLRIAAWFDARGTEDYERALCWCASQLRAMARGEREVP